MSFIYMKSYTTTYYLLILLLGLSIVTFYLYIKPTYTENFDYLTINEFRTKYNNLKNETDNGNLNESNIEMYINEAIDIEQDANGSVGTRQAVW